MQIPYLVCDKKVGVYEVPSSDLKIREIKINVTGQADSMLFEVVEALQDDKELVKADPAYSNYKLLHTEEERDKRQITIKRFYVNREFQLKPTMFDKD